MLEAFLGHAAVEVLGLALLGADAVQQMAAPLRRFRLNAGRLLDPVQPLVQQADQFKDVVADQAFAFFPVARG